MESAVPSALDSRPGIRLKLYAISGSSSAMAARLLLAPKGAAEAYPAAVVAPHSSGATSRIVCANHQWWPSGSLAPKRRSPYS
jgi:hypothetical protein